MIGYHRGDGYLCPIVFYRNIQKLFSTKIIYINILINGQTFIFKSSILCLEIQSFQQIYISRTMCKIIMKWRTNLNTLMFMEQPYPQRVIQSANRCRKELQSIQNQNKMQGSRSIKHKKGLIWVCYNRRTCCIYWRICLLRILKILLLASMGLELAQETLDKGRQKSTGSR